MKTLLFFIALHILSLPLLYSKQFESIRQIEGVVDVTYESPYLWIIIDTHDNRSRILAVASTIINSASDPDLNKIEDPINLRVCDVTTYRFAIADLRHFNSIKTIKDLEAFSKEAYLTTLYTLDWESDPVAVDRKTRKRSSAKLIPDLIEQEKKKLNQVISKLQKEDSRPEKLLFIIKPSIGIVAYPIHKGIITINDQEFEFSKLRLKFVKPN